MAIAPLFLTVQEIFLTIVLLSYDDPLELIGIFDVFNSHHWEAVIYYSGILYLFTTSFQALSMVVVIRLILSSWNGFYDCWS